jgi:hypothetical protein
MARLGATLRAQRMHQSQKFGLLPSLVAIGPVPGNARANAFISFSVIGLVTNLSQFAATSQ